MPLFGYLSGEWLIVAFCIIVFSITLHAPVNWQLAIEDYQHLTRGSVLAAMSYVFLLLGGRTPEGIVASTSPACSGHPLLSLLVAGFVFIVWGA